MSINLICITYTILPFFTISTNRFFSKFGIFFPKYWPHKIQFIHLAPVWNESSPWPGLPSSAASFGVPIGAPTPRGRGPRNGRSGGHRSGGGAGARRDKDEDQDMAGGGGGLFDFSWPKQKGGMIEGGWLLDWDGGGIGCGLSFFFSGGGGCLACLFGVLLLFGMRCFFLWFFGDLLMFGQPCGIPGDFQRGSFWRWWPFTLAQPWIYCWWFRNPAFTTWDGAKPL